MTGPLAAGRPHQQVEVLLTPSRAELRRRLPRLLAGIVLLGVGVGLMVRADLGLGPWDVLHRGLADATGLAMGTVVILVGVVVLVAWVPLRQRLGVGTVLNTLLVGLVIDRTLALVPEAHVLALRVGLLVLATLVLGVATGLYISAGLGPGPRDGLMTGIAARGRPIWLVRTAIELSALAGGVLLGGKVGVGTVVFAFGIGPLAHSSIELFRLDGRAARAGALGPGVVGE